MREILFRGKRLDTGEWVQGFYSRVTDNWTPKNVHFITCFKDLSNGETILTGTYSVDPATVGQFTGLTDKNGKKIFEGDIVRVDFHPEYIGIKSRPSYIGVVEYREGAFGIYEKGKGTQYFFQHGLIKTVIGNIYDNPELLEGDDDV